jgi:hypothetical protein
MVRALRAARLPIPDRMSGAVAFQAYPGLLGEHLSATLSRAGDLDIGRFQSTATAAEERIDPAQALIAEPARQRPDDPGDLWQELCERGPAWRKNAVVRRAKRPDRAQAAVGQGSSV